MLTCCKNSEKSAEENSGPLLSASYKEYRAERVKFGY
jgi:hypothetical protein